MSGYTYDVHFHNNTDEALVLTGGHDDPGDTWGPGTRVMRSGQEGYFEITSPNATAGGSVTFTGRLSGYQYSFAGQASPQTGESYSNVTVPRGYVAFGPEGHFTGNVPDVSVTFTVQWAAAAGWCRPRRRSPQTRAPTSMMPPRCLRLAPLSHTRIRRPAGRSRCKARLTRSQAIPTAIRSG